MNKQRVFLLLALTIVSVGVFFYKINAQRQEVKPPTDKEALENILQAPEKFDRAKVEPPVLKVKNQKESRPTLISELQSRSEPVKQPGVDAKTLYFWQDFASLRSDAIRNPDSPENKAGTISLIKTRQQRLGQSRINKR